jgi:antitoxin HicB
MAVRDRHTNRTVDEYMTLPFRMEVYWDQEGECWAAAFPELPYLVAAAETWEEMPQKIEDAKRAWFESMIEDGKAIPEPRAEEVAFSGNLRLRLPKMVHRQATLAAEREGVSLNTFLVTAVTSWVERTWLGVAGTRPRAESRPAAAAAQMRPSKPGPGVKTFTIGPEPTPPKRKR